MCDRLFHRFEQLLVLERLQQKPGGAGSTARAASSSRHGR
jgi:hypothetical protein